VEVSVEDTSAAERLVALYAGMDRALVEAARSQDPVQAVTELAVAVVPGAEQASISEGQAGRFRTLASTGDMASIGDRIQYELLSGPCVDAMVDDTVFRSDGVADDDRWPAFGPRAHREAGVVSMLSLRLFLESDDRLAGLSLYSTQPEAFGDDDETIATVLATHCAFALQATAARARVANLERALDSNRQIGMAMGILMATHRVTGDDAFALLRIASQNSNRKLAVVADEVIHTGLLELPPTAATAATVRRPTVTKPAPERTSPGLPRPS
jgi:GAF domain-containing protein